MAITLKEGAQLLQSTNWTTASELSHRQLHVEQWYAAQEQHDEVRNQKRTCNKSMKIFGQQFVELLHHYYLCHP